jgi:hypothetical protein
MVKSLHQEEKNPMTVVAVEVAAVVVTLAEDCVGEPAGHCPLPGNFPARLADW